MDAVERQPRERVAGCVCHREVDDDVTLRIGERMQVLDNDQSLDRFAGRERVDRRGQNEIRVSGDSGTNGSTHSSCCATDPDSHECSLADSGGPTAITSRV